MESTLFGIISVRSLIMIICLVPAIVVHEVAHGFVAWKLGDPTAKSLGRLSLNPIKHVDPFGTIVLPLALALFNMPVFGYAKPVPYNPAYFKDIRKGELLTGLAGPAANLIMGILGAIIAALVYFFIFLPGIAPFNITYGILYVCQLFSLINFILMFFNLLPIPPLDGSSIIAIFLSDVALKKYYSIQQYALPALMIIFVVASMTGIPLISWYFEATAGNLMNLLYGFLQ